MADTTQYPKAKYNATLPPRLVYDPEEEKELGDEWFDHPDQVTAPPAVAAKDISSAVTTKNESGT